MNSQHVSYDLKKELNGDITIDGEWLGPGTSFKCFIQHNDHNGNASAKFELSLKDGQVDFEKDGYGGKLTMYGEWEREALKETLEVILKHL